MADDRLAVQYRHALRDLTFNSKPIINNLTMLAHENAAHALTVVQVLIDHFLTVPVPSIYFVIELTLSLILIFFLDFYTA